MRKLFVIFFTLICVLHSVAARADFTLVKTIRVFESTNGIAVNPVTNKVYVSVSTGRGLVVDGRTNTVIKAIAGGTSAVAVNRTTNRIYFATPAIGTVGGGVGVYNGSTDEAIASVPLSGSSGPFTTGRYRLAVNPVTNTIYATVPDTTNDPQGRVGGRVVVIDGVSNTIRASIRLSSAPSGIAVNPKTNRIYVVNGPRAGRGTLSIINGSTNAVVNQVDFDAFSLDVDVNSVTNMIYVTSGNYIVVVDALTNSKVAQIGNREGGPLGLAVNESTNRIYVTDLVRDGTISVIDGATNQIVDTLTGAGVDFTIDVDINEQTRFVYATGFDSRNTGSIIIARDDAVATPDTTAPTITLTSPANGAKLTTFPAITGTVQDNVGGTGIGRVALFIKRSSDGKYFSGRNWSTSAVELPSRLNGSTFTPDFTLPEGVNLRADTYFVTAVAIDRAQPRDNRRSVTASIRIIDTTAPQIVFAYPSDGQQLSQLTKISGMLTDNEGGVGPARVLVQIRRVSDGKYFDGTRWTVDAVALSARLIGSGRAVAWELAGALPPAESRNDIYRITAVGFDRSFNRSVTRSLQVKVGTATTAT